MMENFVYLSLFRMFENSKHKRSATSDYIIYDIALIMIILPKYWKYVTGCSFTR